MKAEIPKNILIYSYFLVVVGFIAGLLGFLFPEIIVSGFDADGDEARKMAAMYGARNVAMACILAIAVKIRQPRVMAAVITMFLMMDLQDYIIEFMYGSIDLLTIIFMTIIMFCVFIVPEIYCIGELLDITIETESLEERRTPDGYLL